MLNHVRIREYQLGATVRNSGGESTPVSYASTVGVWAVQPGVNHQATSWGTAARASCVFTYRYSCTDMAQSRAHVFEVPTRVPRY